jgi:hypothetical protein
LIAHLTTFIAHHPVAITVASILVILVVIGDWRRIRRRGPR